MCVCVCVCVLKHVYKDVVHFLPDKVAKGKRFFS